MTQYKGETRKPLIRSLCGNGSGDNVKTAWMRGVKLALSENTLRTRFTRWRREIAEAGAKKAPRKKRAPATKKRTVETTA